MDFEEKLKVLEANLQIHLDSVPNPSTKLLERLNTLFYTAYKLGVIRTYIGMESDDLSTIAKLVFLAQWLDEITDDLKM